MARGDSSGCLPIRENERLVRLFSKYFDMKTFRQFCESSGDEEYDYRKHSGPRTIDYFRNKGGAKQKFNFGSRFGQDIEPHGRYMTERLPGLKPEEWPHHEHGTVHFKNPLVIPFGGGYGEHDNWKNVLHKQHKVKGRWLSKALIRKGHDGIITHDHNGHSSEIVDLTNFK